MFGWAFGHVAVAAPSLASLPMPPKSAQEKARSPIESLWKAYNEETSDRLKFVDSFLLFLMLSGIIQFVYCILVINYPFNAFLAGYVWALSVVTICSMRL
jgi:oligosaccharyltransferase complex subunit epsilon